MLSHRCSCRRHFVTMVALWRLLPIAQVRSFSIEPPPSTTLTGVRISLYPKVKDSQSLKQTIKDAVAGITDLGVAVKPDDVSSALVGPEPALFEAVRVVFGRACRAEGEPHVSLICTFSAGCPKNLLFEEDAEVDAAAALIADIPARKVESDDWIEDAHRLPGRIAAQFAINPLGSADYQSTIEAVLREAKKSPAYKETKLFCTTLDGDGVEVMDVLKSSFDLAWRKHAEKMGTDAPGHLTMSATLTANKSAWKK